MSTDGRPPRIEVPRWIQLVGLPILLVLAWVVATAAGHVVFLFLIAALVALLLDPIVRGLQRARLPRGLSVALVYLTFFAAVVLVIVAVATAVVGQTKTAADRFNGYFTNRHGAAGQTSADRDVDRLQHWLNTHHLQSVHVEKRGHKLVRQIQQRDVGKYTHKIVTFVEGAAISIGKTLFSLVLLIVVSVYMLLDMERFGRVIDRRYPPRPGEDTLLRSMEHALASYVRGQAAALADHRRERRVRALGARGARSPAARAAVRAALRRRGRDHRGHPVSRPVARRDPAARLRARRASDLGACGSRCSSSASIRSRDTSWCRT